MFDSLSDRLNDTFDRLRGKGKLTEADITSAMRDIRMALLEADVNFKVVKEFVSKTKERCMTAEVMESLSPAQNVVKIVLDELTEMLGSTESKLVFSNRIPNVIMLVGLQGSGKTTAAAKLAYRLKQENHSPLLIAGDVYRPAAITQLQVVGKQLNIPVFEMGQIDPVQIAQEAVKYAGDHGNDMVFLDTAGRLHNKANLMAELSKISRSVKKASPEASLETLLVLDAITGQNAISQAKEFCKAANATGIILTKLDGTAKGGCVVAVKQRLGLPVRFIGVGEGIDDLIPFTPEGFVEELIPRTGWKH